MTATLDAQELQPRALRLSPEEVARLRYLVRCGRCEAVPTELRDADGDVVTRKVGDGHGGFITLPIVVTPHKEGCTGATKIGRPSKMPLRKKDNGVPAGECEWCAAPMVAEPHRVEKKRFCGATCRSSAGKARRRNATEACCAECGGSLDDSYRARVYCSVLCRNRASDKRRALRAAGASS